MVNSNNSEGKRKVREELYNFIRNTILHSNYQKLKVLTLISDKPYELEQTMGQIGVPRQKHNHS